MRSEDWQGEVGVMAGVKAGVMAGVKARQGEVGVMAGLASMISPTWLTTDY